MQIEGGLIWVYGVGEDGVQAFTDFGIENLIELVRLQRKTPSCSRAGNGNDPTSLRPTPDYAGCVPSKAITRRDRGFEEKMADDGERRATLQRAEKPHSTWSIWRTLTVFVG